MTELRLNRDEAIWLLLSAQGLEGKTRSLERATERSVVESIERMGVLQIDTINVVARSPYLVLWSRLGDYEPRWLDQALEFGQIFEYWAHEASFVPVALRPHFRRFMLDGSHRWLPRAREWLDNNSDTAETVRVWLASHGEAKASDFQREDGRTGNGWWDWKPAKMALECMFITGEVVVARRDRFQRVYTLWDRLYPDWNDARTPSRSEAMRELARRSLAGLGVGNVAWIMDYYRLKRPDAREAVASLIEDGELRAVEVDGVPGPHYALTDVLSAIPAQPSFATTTLLSPFDPVVWDRGRLRALFDFEYRIECYTPAAKRQYGYFCLPILHRGAIVGRLDAKAHRSAGRFEVKALHLEQSVFPDDGLLTATAQAIVACARWHGTPDVHITHAEPTSVLEPMRSHVTRLSE